MSRCDIRIWNRRFGQVTPRANGRTDAGPGMVGGQDEIRKGQRAYFEECRFFCVRSADCLSGEKTFFWSGKYHNDLNLRTTIDTQLNVLESFDPIVPNEFKESDILMLGNLGKQATLLLMLV